MVEVIMDNFYLNVIPRNKAQAQIEKELQKTVNNKKADVIVDRFDTDFKREFSMFPCVKK